MASKLGRISRLRNTSTHDGKGEALVREISAYLQGVFHDEGESEDDTEAMPPVTPSPPPSAIDHFELDLAKVQKVQAIEVQVRGHHADRDFAAAFVFLL